MALPELFANNVVTQLTSPCSPTDGAIQVAAPAIADLWGGQFRVRLDNEYMIVTAGQDTTVWIVERGAEGSVATAHASDTVVEHDITAGAVGYRSDPAADVPGLRTLTAMDARYAAAGDVAAETTRAEAAETTNASAITAEAARAAAAEALLAPKASPTFTGSPRAPTQAPSDGSTKLATTAYTDAAASSATATAEAASMPVGTTLNAVPAPVADVGLAGHKAVSAGDATADTDLVNRRTGDGRYVKVADFNIGLGSRFTLFNSHTAGATGDDVANDTTALANMVADANANHRPLVIEQPPTRWRIVEPGIQVPAGLVIEQDGVVPYSLHAAANGLLATNAAIFRMGVDGVAVGKISLRGGMEVDMSTLTNWDDVTFAQVHGACCVLMANITDFSLDYLHAVGAPGPFSAALMGLGTTGGANPQRGEIGTAYASSVRFEGCSGYQGGGIGLIFGLCRADGGVAFRPELHGTTGQRAKGIVCQVAHISNESGHGSLAVSFLAHDTTSLEDVIVESLYAEGGAHGASWNVSESGTLRKCRAYGRVVGGGKATRTGDSGGQFPGCGGEIEVEGAIYNDGSNGAGMWNLAPGESIDDSAAEIASGMDLKVRAKDCDVTDGILTGGPSLSSEALRGRRAILLPGSEFVNMNSAGRAATANGIRARNLEKLIAHGVRATAAVDANSQRLAVAQALQGTGWVNYTGGVGTFDLDPTYAHGNAEKALHMVQNVNAQSIQSRLPIAPGGVAIPAGMQLAVIRMWVYFAGTDNSRRGRIGLRFTNSDNSFYGDVWSSFTFYRTPGFTRVGGVIAIPATAQAGGSAQATMIANLTDGLNSVVGDAFWASDFWLSFSASAALNQHHGAVANGGAILDLIDCDLGGNALGSSNVTTDVLPDGTFTGVINEFTPLATVLT